MHKTRPNASLWPTLLLAAMTALTSRGTAADRNAVRAEDWTHIVEMPRPPRRGKQRPPVKACLWLPKGVDKVRGLFYPGAVMIEKKLGTDPAVRASLAAEGMGVLFYPLDTSIIKVGHTYLERALARLAKESGHPEVEFAPMLTAGHSAAGLFCRNVAYWKPHRVIGVVMIKSGNFHHAIEDLSRSLRTVPLVHFSGEFEEYGPEGGDLGRGLRSAYATTGPDGKARNQTQWVMTRMQMLDRRRKDEDNVWTLVVHRGGRHTTWNADMTALLVRYIHGLAAARIPKSAPDGKTEVRCIPMTAKGGWLYDADIKNPRHKPAPYADYAGDRKLAFWAPDEAMARAIWKYHQAEPWSAPDPTVKDPVAKRFYPPPILRDFVDAPPPPISRWAAGSGAWGSEGTSWRRDGKRITWDDATQAVFDGDGGTVTLPAGRTCTGLVLGKGYMLELGANRLKVRWHARFAAGSELSVRLHAKSSRGIGRGGAMNVVGNAAMAGTLTVTMEDRLKPGDYGIVAVNGVRTGDFGKVVLPEGLTARWVGSGYYVTVPKPLTAKERKERSEAKARKTQVSTGGALPARASLDWCVQHGVYRADEYALTIQAGRKWRALEGVVRSDDLRLTVGAKGDAPITLPLGWSRELGGTR